MITGAAQGIGKEIAIKFANEGSNLILCDINEKLLEQTAAEIQQKYTKINILTSFCDVGDKNSVTAFYQKTKPVKIDIVINNAGVVSGQPFLQLTEEQITRTMKVNLLSFFWINQLILPQMLERNQGHLVSIASTCGFLSASRLSDYCASKHALISAHNSLRLEVLRMRKKVDFTLICPNTTNTGMFKGVKQKLRALIPILTPEQVASAVLDSVKHKKALVILPKRLTLGAKLMKSELLPQFVEDFILSISGATSGMDTFVGKY